MAEAEALARRLANLSPEAAQAAKRAVVEGGDMPLQDGLALEERRALEVAAALPR
jgi:enoyl-CoA hydratase/carnithine racemase